MGKRGAAQPAGGRRGEGGDRLAFAAGNDYDNVMDSGAIGDGNADSRTPLSLLAWPEKEMNGALSILRTPF